jgi:hypothetical protein
MATTRPSISSMVSWDQSKVERIPRASCHSSYGDEAELTAEALVQDGLRCPAGGIVRCAAAVHCPCRRLCAGQYGGGLHDLMVEAHRRTV